MFEREEIDYSEEEPIILESKKDKQTEIDEAWTCCFLANYAPSFEDFVKTTKIKITKNKYEEMCKKMHKKTM